MGVGGWISSDKENFLVQKELDFIEDALVGEVWPEHFKFTGHQRTKSPVSSTFECPCKSDSGQMMYHNQMDCQASQEPLGMAA